VTRLYGKLQRFQYEYMWKYPAIIKKKP